MKKLTGKEYQEARKKRFHNTLNVDKIILVLKALTEKMDGSLDLSDEDWAELTKILKD